MEENFVKYELRPATVIERDGFPVGLERKRGINPDEADYILEDILGMRLPEREGLEPMSDGEFLKRRKWRSYMVSDWLDGKLGDRKPGDCPFGKDGGQMDLFRAVRLIAYLQEKDII